MINVCQLSCNTLHLQAAPYSTLPYPTHPPYWHVRAKPRNWLGKWPFMWQRSAAGAAGRGRPTSCSSRKQPLTGSRPVRPISTGWRSSGLVIARNWPFYSKSDTEFIEYQAQRTSAGNGPLWSIVSIKDTRLTFKRHYLNFFMASS